MNIERTSDGKPVIKYGKHSVVAADALSLLSGVNFGSVVKMLAALNALHSFTAVDMQALADYGNVPTERVQPDDVYDQIRADATLALCKGIADSRKYPHLEGVLKLRGRFNG